MKEKKKKKEKKLSPEQERVISVIKQCLDEFIRSSSEALSVSYGETLIDDEPAFVACVEYPAFTQKIMLYNPFVTDIIDFKFSFSGAQRDYGLYEIFNLFEIEDFNVYYYDSLETVQEVKEAIREINGVTHKYMPYIENASKSENLELLYQQYEEDCIGIFGSREEWKADGNDIFFDITNPVFTFADMENTQKLHKKLKKLNKKGGLSTKYEKRLFAYLESGKALPERNINKKSKRSKSYSKAKIKVYALIISVTCAVLILLGFAVKKLLFADALYAANSYTAYDLIFSLMASFFFCFGSIMAFGSRIIHKFVSGDQKEFAKEKFENENSGSLGAKSNYAFTAAFYIIGIAVFLMFSFSSFGFYDNEIKYMESAFTGTESVSYEELVIYKVRGYYEDDEYYENENDYAIAGASGQFYDIGELEKSGETETYLLSVAEKYNKEITEIESVDEYTDSSIF